MRETTNVAAKSLKERGSVLVTTLVSLSLVMVVGAGVLSLTMHGLHLTKRTKRSTVAFNLAESGTDEAMRWLKDQSSPPSGTAAFNPFGGTQSLNGGTYSVSIDPDDANAGAVLKKYKITATATYAGHTDKIELIMRQSSFGKYAYFTDSETSAITGGRIWFYSGDRIRGPAHSNNAGGSDFQINWNGADGVPIFDSMVTGAGDDINYSPSDPDTEAEFGTIYGNGSLGYQLGVDNIPMPGSTDAQKVAAWGGTSGFPTNTSVNVRSGGGVFVSGDSTIAMSVTAGGDQQMVITQGSTVTTVEFQKSHNRRRVRVGSGAWTNVAGLGNGVVYSNGNITSLSGSIANNTVSGSNVTVRNAFTIATDVNNGKDITVTNPITCASQPNPALPVNHATNLLPGTLGLMARNVKVGATAPTNMQIDAIVMAGGQNSSGSFYVENYNTKTPTGTLKVMGGIIQKSRGPVGTLNGSGLLGTGYAKDYWYDPRLADNPPPFFPTTGTYDRISWRRLVP